MGFLELLTLIFVVAKLCGFIVWAWWIVLSPELLAIALYIVLFGGLMLTTFKRLWRR